MDDELFKLLLEFEGCRLEAYQDLGGIWTIGYGHTGEVRRGMVISPIEAIALLREDVRALKSRLIPMLACPINSNQLQACISLAFNIGIGNFAHSTLLKKINRGQADQAAGEFLRWDKVDEEEVPGLLRRRMAERALYLKPPSPLFSPPGPRAA